MITTFDLYFIYISSKWPVWRKPNDFNGFAHSYLCWWPPLEAAPRGGKQPYQQLLEVGSHCETVQIFEASSQWHEQQLADYQKPEHMSKHRMKNMACHLAYQICAKLIVEVMLNRHGKSCC